MANNFITNDGKKKSLNKRLNTLISISEELKFLVGFFYFSGWWELYEQLKNNEHIRMKLLVGLQVDKALHDAVIEHDHQEAGLSRDDVFNRFIKSLGLAVNNEKMDTEEFYTQVEFFIEMLENERLIIRKTEKPNHAKVYLFRLNEEQSEIQNMTGQFVTGSSNLTKSGLSGQEEFNVEIRDYGYAQAEQYFDELWERAVPVSEVDSQREALVHFIKNKSQAATVTPFEAYALILKTQLDLMKQKNIKPEVERLLEERGFKKFSYQIDAVRQALSIIEEYNGVIIADVVGLGKSVIASLIAKNMGKRGMVICPPGLAGDRNTGTGWWGYVQDFKLYDWEVNSRGKLPEIAEHINDRDIEVVIVDEAHYFRNQDTADYEALSNICKNRQVILLTATPFNNSPADIFALLKLFLVPGKSGITIEDNLELKFSYYNSRFKQFSDILKNVDSRVAEKRQRAERLYLRLFEDAKMPVDIDAVRRETKRLANEIKNVISPVLIRRNRLDLKNDFLYSKEITELSDVKDPEELFYYLTPKQSDFYDRILSDYFEEDGRFKGAIYQPFLYEKDLSDPKKEQSGTGQTIQQQRNLYDFMRRLLVKRFESSFGAFSKTIDRFISVHDLVQKFIGKTGGKYMLDRDLMERIIDSSEEEIDEILDKFEKDLLNKKVPKNNTVYNINNFKYKEKFLAEIESDKELFIQIRDELNSLDFVENDPKRDAVYRVLKEMPKKEPNRKVIIFSEYVDTVNHLAPYLRDKLGNRLLVCDGNVTKKLAKELISDFDAQYSGKQTNEYQVLLTSDKLAEGFNLNRAGLIVNYDIPWNPTRVIQRVGRINRIGTKVFDELLIYNFFPSEEGADVVRSRQIAEQKMFLIHNALGEDSKIFNADEEPTPSGLFSKINTQPEEEGEISISTIVRNAFNEIAENHPEVIEKIKVLPPRVKTAKKFSESNLAVLRKKGLSLFAQYSMIQSGENRNTLDESPTVVKDELVKEIPYGNLLPLAECEFDEPKLPLSTEFWPHYNQIKQHKPTVKSGKKKGGASLESKAQHNLKVGIKLAAKQNLSVINFMETLLLDLRRYHTLSERTLGRIGRKELNLKSNDKQQKAFFEEIQSLRNTMGVNYLDLLLKRVENQKEETIIAVENRCT